VRVRRLGLGIKFSILVIVTMLLMFAAYFAWRNQAEGAQAENEMLEKAQILSQEMDAMWDFFEANQHNFAKDANGNYTLYCVIAAKAVSKFFTNETDYVIHYTNVTTRRPADAPDAFEEGALAALFADREATEVYEFTTDVEGRQVFRYVKPLLITRSCLECHGEPVGELDAYGFPKEGQQIGDIAGAISITMPLDVYLQGMNANILSDVAFSVMVVIAGFSVVMAAIYLMVSRPLRRMEAQAANIEEGNLNVDFLGIGYHDEISELAMRFESMTKNLRNLYANLESQVQARTLQLTEVNETLTSQRAQLADANELLAESYQFKSDFLAIMSHELRTPLTSIIAFAEMWEQTHKVLDEKELVSIHEIQTNGQILLNMVNNILEMARLEAGKLELVCEPVDLADLVGHVERTLSFLAVQRNIEFTTVFEHGVPIIYADWEKLRRILENLTTNAIKFTQKGGRVSILVKKKEGEEAVVLTVSDTGMGISQKDIDLVFDKFTQADKSSMRRYRGSGLGLVVVKELVELHGGEIAIDSVQKQGTVISVTIPSGEKSWEELS
jgi:signal transduction histidine kinase